MKRLPILSSVLAFSLVMSAPAAFAHAGHGDEFEATGGVNRVEVRAETDSILGIQVEAIEPAADGSGAVLVPVTALVDDNSRQLVFVEYEGFYEPVDVVTGATQGELIEVTEGLSVGEALVTQGGLSLYAESRKAAPDEALDEASAETQVESIEPEGPAEVTEELANGTVAETTAEAQQKEIAQDSATTLSSNLIIAAGIGGAVIASALVIFVKNRAKKENA